MAVGLVLVVAALEAEPLPGMPPAGYDKPGRYPAGTVHWGAVYYSSAAGCLEVVQL